MYSILADDLHNVNATVLYVVSIYIFYLFEVASNRMKGCSSWRRTEREISIRKTKII
jgi:hypothetical protein